MCACVCACVFACACESVSVGACVCVCACVCMRVRVVRAFTPSEYRPSGKPWSGRAFVCVRACACVCVCVRAAAAAADGRVCGCPRAGAERGPMSHEFPFPQSDSVSFSSRHYGLIALLCTKASLFDPVLHVVHSVPMSAFAGLMVPRRPHAAWHK